MGIRRLARETALQALYLFDITRLSPDDALDSITKGHEFLDDQSAEFAKALVHGTRTNLAEIDKEIQSIAGNRQLGRMATVDRNIIRKIHQRHSGQDKIPEETNRLGPLAGKKGPKVPSQLGLYLQ